MKRGGSDQSLYILSSALRADLYWVVTHALKLFEMRIAGETLILVRRHNALTPHEIDYKICRDRGGQWAFEVGRNASVRPYPNRIYLESLFERARIALAETIRTDEFAMKVVPCCGTAR